MSECVCECVCVSVSVSVVQIVYWSHHSFVFRLPLVLAFIRPDRTNRAVVIRFHYLPFSRPVQKTKSGK